MNFWLRHTNKDIFRLPVTPESFEVSVAHKNTVVDIVSLGEVKLLGKTGLRGITLSSFFPAQDYYFAKADRREPKYYINKLEKWRKSNTIIRLIIDGAINMQCTVESFSWGQQDGTKDIYYDITLKEYRTVSTKKRTQKKIKATKHKIKKGDTLSRIAKKYYGKSNVTYRNKIIGANRKLLKNKNKLPVGKTLKIPALTLTSWESKGKKPSGK